MKALQEDTFVGFCFRSLTGLLFQPRRYFTVFAGKWTFGRAFGFLLIACFCYTLASSAVSFPSLELKTAVIAWINALGMCLISTLLSYLIMVMTFKNRVSFNRLFGVYAMSTGVTLMVSWVPYFIWFTELWKWWLVGTGMEKGCKFRRRQTVMMIIATILLLVGIFGALSSLIVAVQNYQQ